MIKPELQILETERLILRPFELSDIDPSYQMNLDAAVSRYTGDGGILSKEEVERRVVENVMGDYKKYGFGRLAIEVKGGEKFIGFAGLKYLDNLNEVDLGYRLMQHHWGKGFATEAAEACIQFGFETLKLKRMIAMVLPENSGSIRVLEKTGFKYDREIMEDGLLAKQYVLLPV